MVEIAADATHNGIPVWWSDSRDVATGSLIFGVGIRDEPVATLGITHLLEHIILNRMEPITVVHSAVVTEETVTFSAWGKPRDVTAFLNAVAESIRTIGDLTEATVKLEKRSVEAEKPYNYNNAQSGLLTYRYGVPGIGSSNFGVPATVSITRQELVDWCVKWFVVDNAALTFNFASPPGLDVRIPIRPVVRFPQERHEIATPVLVESEKGGVALSLLVGEESAELLGEAIRVEMLATLRHWAGLIYSVGVLITRVNESQVELAFVLDPLDRHLAKTVRKSVAELRRFSDVGFAGATIAAVHNDAEASWTDDARKDFDVGTHALDHVFGRRSSPSGERVAAAMSSTSESLRRLLSESMGSLLVAYDRDSAKKKDLPNRSVIRRDKFWPWQPMTPTELASISEEDSTWDSRNSKSTLVLTPSHLIDISAGRSRGIALADIRLVGITPDNVLILVDYRGRYLRLDRRDAVKWKSLRTSILERFPAEIVRTFADR